MTDFMVSEVFGPTVQGEGPSMGRRCAFIRLGLCNLDCRWCDTPYTWDWAGKNGTAYDREVELTRIDVAGLVEQVAALGVDLVVISGGEPLVQRNHLVSLVGLLASRGMEVEVETNGTLAPTPALLDAARWNVSPKLAHSGIDLARRIHPDVLHLFSTAAKGAAFKFVCQQPSDLDEVALIVDTADLPEDRVWIMPEGITPTTVAITGSELADAVVARGWNLTTRLHVLVWGNRRGV